MTDAHETTLQNEHIHWIETGLLPRTSLWSEQTALTTLQKRMANYKLPGASVALINHGEIAWARGYGVQEAGTSRAVTSETIFQACSISKHVAMVGTLRLVQEGVLNLDEDVNTYLRSWKIPGWSLNHSICRTAATIKRIH
jgi:CubicO group peptidase (beta-lactamase class C family)